jgi:hypothetical protein
LIRRISGTEQHASANALMLGGRLPRGSWAVLGRKLRRLLIDPPSFRPPITNYPSFLYNPSCPLPPPHQPRILNFYPFSTPPWNLTGVKPRRTWHRTRSFPAFSRAIPPRLSSLSCETKFRLSINPGIKTMDSRNGLSRL